MGDSAAGLFAVTGILAAPCARARTGRGAQVDISILDSLAAPLESAAARHTAIGELPGLPGARHPTITPFGAFPAADGRIAIRVGTGARSAAPAVAVCRPVPAAAPRRAPWLRATPATRESRWTTRRRA